MYKEKFVVAVKSNGKVLREFGDTVKLPVGSEFSIFLKNMNSVKAQVSISIDGTDIADGETFVVNANSSLDIERFLKKGNKNRGNKFKFIQRTAKIEDGPRGIQAEDGLIRVAFKFEKRAAKVEEETVIKKTIYETYYKPHYPYSYPYPPYYWDKIYCVAPQWTTTTTLNAFNGDPAGKIGGIGTSNLQDGVAQAYSVSTGATGGTVGEGKGMGGGGWDGSVNCSATHACVDPSSFLMNASNTVQEFNEQVAAKTSSILRSAGMPKVSEEVAGITVPGGISDQQFVTVPDFVCEDQEYVVVLKLVGYTGEVPVAKPVTVKAKQKCPMPGCEHINKATAKYCSECGSGLEII